MCGIAGFASSVKQKERIIKKMTDKIYHRGPDDEGFFIDENIALGMKRLSIIDLKSGKQPMQEKGLVLVFNGEIYNYQNLRDLLIDKGYKFETKSDTEVLLKMYIEYGEGCLRYLDGMFVFAIYDLRRREVFIARDRLGKKPIYYTHSADAFVFGSEIKTILEYPSVRKKLNVKVINCYFQYRYVLGNETFFKHIFSVPSGSYLKFSISKKTIEIKKYWELPIIPEKKDLGEKFYLNNTRSLLTSAIKKRMISDVPLGAYLSGGLDSSIVVGVMAELRGIEKLSTFTIGFEEEGFNEFNYADLVVKRCKTDHHKILLKANDYIDTMNYLISFKDCPLAVPNEVPLYLMSKELKKYITVVLSGEGADELFGGYGRIFKSYLEFQGNSFLDFFLNRYNYTSDQDLGKILDKNILKEINRNRYSYLIFKELFKKIENLPIEDKIPYVFQNVHLLGLLQRLDTTTMAASVEGRAPFVDVDLVEFANSMPFKYKIKWKSQQMANKAILEKLSSREISERYDTTKYILRKAFRNYLPKEIINRKKVGFPVPLNDWFHGKFKEYSNEILNNKITINRGIYDKNFLLSQECLKLNGMTIWMMINLELFLRRYFD